MTDKLMPKSAEAYERAIARAEKTFHRNKSRMWVLKILRDYLEQEALDAALGGAPPAEAK